MFFDKIFVRRMGINGENGDKLLLLPYCRVIIFMQKIILSLAHARRKLVVRIWEDVALLKYRYSM